MSAEIARHSPLRRTLSPYLEDGAKRTLSRQNINRQETTILRRTRLKRLRYMIIFATALPILVLVGLLFASKAYGWNFHTSLNWGQRAVDVANYVGDASFAISGTVEAGKKGMDGLGCVLIGFITALGGGSVRDICMGLVPLKWMTEWPETILCGCCGLVTFFAWSPLSHYFNISERDEWLFWTDTIGLGVFAASGAHMGDVNGATPLGSVFCGLMTATFGGMVRDTLCQQPARILFADMELYALPAILGAATYKIVASFGDEYVVDAILVGSWIGMFGRVVAINHFIVMPTFSTDWWGIFFSGRHGGGARKRQEGGGNQDEDNEDKDREGEENGTEDATSWDEAKGRPLLGVRSRVGSGFA